MNHSVQRRPDNAESRSRVGEALMQAGFTTVGALAGNPTAQLLLALAPQAWTVIKTVLTEAVSLPDTPRERMRMLNVSEFVVSEIVRRREAGENIRTDGFFDHVMGGRAQAEVVFEAVLRTCLRQYEEDKLLYIANIYVNASFRRVSSETVNSILHQAEDKTWRHFCFISLLCSPNGRELAVRFSLATRESLEAESDAAYLRDDIERLHGRASGLIEGEGETLRLTPSGKLFAELTQLNSMSDDGLVGITQAMKMALDCDAAGVD